MFVEPIIPKPADQKPLRRLTTGTGLDALLWDIGVGKVNLDEIQGRAGRKEVDGTSEHLIMLHTPIVVVPKHGPPVNAMAFIVTKDPKGELHTSWYDNVKEAECSYYVEDEHEEDL